MLRPLSAEMVLYRQMKSVTMEIRMMEMDVVRFVLWRIIGHVHESFHQYALCERIWTEMETLMLKMMILMETVL